MIVRCEASALIIRSLPSVGLGTDTGKRMIRGQISESFGESLDKEWLYVDAPAGRGWASRRYLVEHANPSRINFAWPKVPTGLDEIKRLFGSPANAMASAGKVYLPAYIPQGWKTAEGEEVKVMSFACHKLLEDVFTSVFIQIHSRGYWPLIATYDGCYNDRTVTSSQKISSHAWGISVDLNAASNRLGSTPTMPREIIAIFSDHGFQWGGEWIRPDGMHFQYAKGY